MKSSLVLTLALFSAQAAAADIDWQAVAAEDVVRIITVDPDGGVRERKVWIAVHDGSGWLRTSNSRWLANIRRDPDVRLRIGERVLELRAAEVTDAATRSEIDAAMRAKYGWADRMLGPFRWRASNVLRLGPRTP